VHCVAYLYIMKKNIFCTCELVGLVTQVEIFVSARLWVTLSSVCVNQEIEIKNLEASDLPSVMRFGNLLSEGRHPALS
jgi:hypothetical protein